MRKRTADFLVRMATLRRTVYPGEFYSGYSSRRDWDVPYHQVPCVAMVSGFILVPAMSTYGYYAGG